MSETSQAVSAAFRATFFKDCGNIFALVDLRFVLFKICASARSNFKIKVVMDPRSTNNRAGVIDLEYMAE